MEPAIASKSQGFPNIPIFNSDWSSLKAFTALNISIVTKTDNERVDGIDLPTVK